MRPVSSTLSVSPLCCFGEDCIYNVLSHIHVVQISQPIKDGGEVPRYAEEESQYLAITLENKRIIKCQMSSAM